LQAVGISAHDITPHELWEAKGVDSNFFTCKPYWYCNQIMIQDNTVAFVCNGMALAEGVQKTVALKPREFKEVLELSENGSATYDEYVVWCLDGLLSYSMFLTALFHGQYPIVSGQTFSKGAPD
jgi:hypothetical protein